MIRQNDRERLNGVHIDLVNVVIKASDMVEFAILEGVRSPERQRALFEAGRSHTMNSRHLTGHAVDIVPVVSGKISWEWRHFFPIAKVMEICSGDLGIPIEWGGSWKRAGELGFLTLSKKFADGAHFQLPRKEYP